MYLISTRQISEIICPEKEISKQLFVPLCSLAGKCINKIEVNKVNELPIRGMLMPQNRLLALHLGFKRTKIAAN